MFGFRWSQVPERPRPMRFLRSANEGALTIDDLIAALDATADRSLPPAALRLLGPVRVPPPSPDELEAFEAEIGTTLPDDYRRFLLRSNGGSLDGKYCFENEKASV